MGRNKLKQCSVCLWTETAPASQICFVRHPDICFLNGFTAYSTIPFLSTTHRPVHAFARTHAHARTHACTHTSLLISPIEFQQQWAFILRLRPPKQCTQTHTNTNSLLSLSLTYTHMHTLTLKSASLDHQFSSVFVHCVSFSPVSSPSRPGQELARRGGVIWDISCYRPTHTHTGGSHSHCAVILYVNISLPNGL